MRSAFTTKPTHAGKPGVTKERAALLHTVVTSFQSRVPAASLPHRANPTNQGTTLNSSTPREAVARA